MNVKNVTLFPRRYIQTVKPHRPLIKFRKGAIPDSSTSQPADEANLFKRLQVRPVLEDFQLPLKYRRHPLDEAEINAINSGGVY